MAVEPADAFDTIDVPLDPPFVLSEIERAQVRSVQIDLVIRSDKADKTYANVVFNVPEGRNYLPARMPLLPGLRLMWGNGPFKRLLAAFFITAAWLREGRR